MNIAQPFASSGMMLTCLAETGIKAPADFADKTLGVWFFGNEYPFLSWMAQLGLATDGSAGGVTVLKQGFNVDPLLQKQAACISTMTYNEYWQVIDAGHHARAAGDLQVSRTGRGDAGRRALRAGRQAGRPGVRGDDGQVRPRLMKGWKYAEANPDEAAMIVLENDQTGAQTEAHQKRMMGEVAKLTAGSNGALDVAAAERTVATLLAGGSDPVITAAPTGAWTSAITDKALAKLI